MSLFAATSLLVLVLVVAFALAIAGPWIKRQCIENEPSCMDTAPPPLRKEAGVMGWYVLIYLVIVGFGIWGWVQNLLVVWHSNFSHVDGELVIRFAGIFLFPIGMVAGYIH